MSDSPPPAYSLISDNDPFVDHPPAPSSQAPVSQPPPNQAALDPRVRFGYGPEILAPADLVEPPRIPENGKFYVVPVCPEPGIVGSWILANDLTRGMPGGTSKGHKLWESAVQEYTLVYNRGGLKVRYPPGSSSTPGHSVSTPVVVHSTAPTPSLGSRIQPIHLSSSPAATPTRAPAHATVAQHGSITPGTPNHPIFVDSSPAPTPVHATGHTTGNGTPSTPTRSAETPKYHQYINRAFAKLTAEQAVELAKISTAEATAPSTPIASTPQSSPTKSQAADASPSETHAAAWRDPTPVSIPLARLFTPDSASPSKQKSHDHDFDGDSDDDESSDGDDEYFKNYPMTRKERAALLVALADPRFDLP